MGFGDDLQKESENVIKAINETVKVAAIELFSGIITSSPVGNPELWDNPSSAPPGYTGGSFRSNWYLTQRVASVKYDEDLIVSESERVSSVTNRIRATISESWILTNNAPYAQRIESGWSTQAPAGVVAPNESRVNANFKRIEAAANRRYGVS